MLLTPKRELIFLATFLKIYMLHLYHQGFSYVLLKPHEKESNISIITFGQILIVGYFFFIKHEICSISFLFLLGAAIVFCTYCYVKPLRYLKLSEKTSNSIKTLRTHRILILQNRNKTWNLSCNNIPKRIQLTHTVSFSGHFQKQ